MVVLLTPLTRNVGQAMVINGSASPIRWKAMAVQAMMSSATAPPG